MIIYIYSGPKVYCRYCRKEMKEIVLGVPIKEQACPECVGKALAKEAMDRINTTLIGRKGKKP
jgi:hypothetical protein